MVTKTALAKVVDILDGIGSVSTTDRGLRTVGITRRSLRHSPGFVPYESSVLLGETVARILGEPHLGAMVGTKFEYRALGSYSTHVLAAPNLLRAMNRGVQALNYVNPGCSVILRYEGQYLVISFDPNLPQSQGSRMVNESLPFLLASLVREYVGPDWLPAWVELPDRPITAEGNLEELFGTDIRFGAAMPGVAMRQTDLFAPNPRPVTRDAAITSSDLSRELGIEPIHSFVDEVQHMLVLQYLLGDTSAEAVAKRLSLGVRGMQRRLQEQGTNYREMKQAFLRNRACILLRQSNASVDEISKLLGYDEPNNFRRAFHKWTGVSPLRYVNLHQT
ncbi:AraC family transcriptional regulator ligand-binding domain-containing protein [Tropicimonas sp. TH_r6]|uniref:AraC family transcriptional regulator n=1 Tax=Tropicimonas sp. TH_r6 TaxID=3082085 RepID=UPI002955C6BF|nr:AraC family transcriptional regulator ligand-binding domain-containing protein [Tropicimonas sp. TH_r6]MDV7145812.1 AraC family transcriptional regulator ligand-binding domain-containing protein [Tropicimonas sp. TH_r6]